MCLTLFKKKTQQKMRNELALIPEVQLDLRLNAVTGAAVKCVLCKRCLSVANEYSPEALPETGIKRP